MSSNNHWIQNFDELAKTGKRRVALEIAEAGLSAINTEKIIAESIKLDGNLLKIKDKEFDLSKFKSVKLIGFGKAASAASAVMLKILGNKITRSIIIDKKEQQYTNKTPVQLANFNQISNVAPIINYHGTHPEPSWENFQYSDNLINSVRFSEENDLVIVIVSGGGSALFCWPKEECLTGIKLYNKFLETGKTIKELNTIRKHLSLVKGGGLAKILYPATVIGLIFSDIPGDHYENVASGPTYKDATTIQDAEKIIKENNLGEFNLVETPKEDKYFEKITNIVMVSNLTALEAMAAKAEELGLKAKIISGEIYDTASETIEKFISGSELNSVLLGGGEIRLKVEKSGGSGGRNSYLAMTAIGKIKDGVFLSIASDGLDNCQSAGALTDEITAQKSTELGLDLNDYIERYNSHDLFEKLGDIIYTGPTGANVSDLMLLIK